MIELTKEQLELAIVKLQRAWAMRFDADDFEESQALFEEVLAELAQVLGGGR